MLSVSWFGVMLRDKCSWRAERGERSCCVSGVVTRLVKTCLQVVGWSAWTVNLSSCWPVLDKVQDQVGHCCFSYRLQTQLRTFQANLGWFMVLGGNHKQTTSNCWILPQTRQSAWASVSFHLEVTGRGGRWRKTCVDPVLM